MKDIIIVFLGVALGTLLYEIFTAWYNEIRVAWAYRKVKKEDK